MPQLPTGSITLLFTDIEGSTRLLHQLGNRYAVVLRECRRLLRAAFQQANGVEVDTQGDSFFVVFERAADAVAAAEHAQRALFTAPWPDEAVVRVRMGMHTGEPQPTDEGYIGLDVHRAARIMSAAHGGQVLLSQETRDLVKADLPEDVSLRELGAYRLKDIAHPNHLFQLVISGLPADFPPLTALSSQRPLRNIPSPTTSFIGREAEVVAISDLMRRDDVRLLTLIGTAGVGKTRLALQVAAQLGSFFTDGQCFVALDQVSSPEAVLPALAQSLNIQEEKERSLLEQVKAILREQAVLLILDNFEQVLPASLLITDLLAACPKLKVLVTSRVMLHLQAEHLFEVPSLPLPDSRLYEHLSAPATLSHYASVALFVQRASAVQPDFQLTRANANAVACICVHLDGIPLAIELAAARVRHFSPQTLLARLEHGLAVLQGEAQDIPARQQTLRGAIAWSYDLLEPAEQRVFRRFAIFVNGAMLEAADQICAGAEKEHVAEALVALVDKSMLQRQRREGDEERYGQLLTLREYGLERLSEAGELEATQAAHAEYFLSWVEQASTQLSGAEQANWLDSLDREYENVRAASDWLLQQAGTSVEPAEQALRLCIALLGFWEIRGYVAEGLALLERALTNRQGVAPSILAQALHGAALLALIEDDNARAEGFLRECQLLFRESGDRAGMANILQLQGNLALVRSSYKLARRMLEEALAMYQELGDGLSVASTREALAQIAITQGDYSKAQSLLEKNIASYLARGERYRVAYPLFLLARMLFLSQWDRAEAHARAEESLALFRAVGNKRFIAYALSLLGQIVLIEERDAGKAGSMVEESIAIFKSIADRFGTAEARIALARVKSFEGKHEAARACYQESWQLLKTIDAKELSAACLEGYGEVLVAPGTRGATNLAAKLWGTAATVRAAIVAPMPQVYRTAYRQALALARERLGEAAFQSAWAEGHSLSLEQVELSYREGSSTRSQAAS